METEPADSTPEQEARKTIDANLRTTLPGEQLPPPTVNASYAWILHMVSELPGHDVAGFVLANGSISTNTKGEGETLFIDARKIGSMISRTQKEFDADDIGAIAATYHLWRGESLDAEAQTAFHNSSFSIHNSAAYADVPGYCKSATLEDMRKHDYVLTPGSYVGAAALEDDGIPFETKMAELSKTLFSQMIESAKLDEAIRQNLKGLGYEE